MLQTTICNLHCSQGPCFWLRNTLLDVFKPTQTLQLLINTDYLFLLPFIPLKGNTATTGKLMWTLLPHLFIYTHILIYIYFIYKLKNPVTVLSFIPLVLTVTHLKFVLLHYTNQSRFIPLLSSPEYLEINITTYLFSLKYVNEMFKAKVPHKLINAKIYTWNWVRKTHSEKSYLYCIIKHTHLPLSVATIKDTEISGLLQMRIKYLCHWTVAT